MFSWFPTGTLLICMASQERFGYEWNKYSWVNEHYEQQFRNWTHPFTPEDWKGKIVLDAGCGMGRNSYWPLKWGATSVTAFDFDERSVSRAKETLKEFSGAETLFKSIYDIEWKGKYDIAFSIGVIHHLENPKLALKNIVSSLKPRGKLLVWVYGYEGNEWIVRFVDPIRIHITSKLPLGLVHFLAYFCTVPLYAYIHFLKPKNKYLTQLRSFEFWHVHSIVFDQLIPRVANYWKKTEVEELVKDLPLHSLSISAPPNGSGWILIGEKKNEQ